MKTKKSKDNWSENDENRWTACHEFALELSDLLRVYISPKKGRKVANKLYSFIEDETRRFEGFKKAYPGGSSEDSLTDAEWAAKSSNA